MCTFLWSSRLSPSPARLGFAGRTRGGAGDGLQRARHRVDVDRETDRRARAPVARQQAVVAAAAQNGVRRAGDECLEADAGVVVEAAHLAQIDVKARVQLARADRR